MFGGAPSSRLGFSGAIVETNRVSELRETTVDTLDASRTIESQEVDTPRTRSLPFLTQIVQPASAGVQFPGLHRQHPSAGASRTTKLFFFGTGERRVCVSLRLIYHGARACVAGCAPQEFRALVLLGPCRGPADHLDVRGRGGGAEGWRGTSC
eukprot:gene11104-biopygen4830